MNVDLHPIVENGVEIYCSCLDQKYFKNKKVVFRNHLLGLYYRHTDNIVDKELEMVEKEIFSFLGNQQRVAQEFSNKNTLDILVNDIKYECGFLKEGNRIDVSQIIITKKI